MRKILFLVLVSLVLILVYGTSVSLAQHPAADKPYGSACNCHAGNFSIGLHASIGSGDTCAICHKPHEALSSSKLLPAATQSKVCFTCHDGTTGNLDGDADNTNVIFGEVSNAAVTGNTASRHTVDITTETSITITGSGVGVSVYGTDTVPYGSSLSEDLNCSSCHTPHGNAPISNNFVSKNGRTNSKLLKSMPGDTTTATNIYGVNWCISCHGSAFGGAMADHPMSTNVAYSSSIDHGVTATPSYRPICMSCHDDARSVTNFPGPAEGAPALDNFPHETTVNKFLVEAGDSLCLNCHVTSGLP